MGNQFIGMGLALKGALAEKFDSDALKEKWKKQSREDQKNLKMKVNKLLDKLIAQEGYFPSDLPLNEAKACKYLQLELEFLRSTGTGVSEEGNEDNLEKALSTKGSQKPTDAFACCRKIRRFFERLIGWDVSKDTIIAKLNQLKELRDKNGLLGNKETIRQASEAAAGLSVKTVEDYIEYEALVSGLAEKLKKFMDSSLLPQGNHNPYFKTYAENVKYDRESNKKGTFAHALQQCEECLENPNFDKNLKKKLKILIEDVRAAHDSIDTDLLILSDIPLQDRVDYFKNWKKTIDSASLGDKVGKHLKEIQSKKIEIKKGNILIFQYLEAKQDANLYYERRLNNLSLIKKQESEVQAFCNNMLAFFNSLSQESLQIDKLKNCVGLCTTKIEKMEKEIVKLKINLNTIINSKKVNKNELDKKLKRNDIRNPDGTLILEFKMGLTQHELKFLHLEKQIENYNFFKMLLKNKRKILQNLS